MDPFAFEAPGGKATSNFDPGSTDCQDSECIPSVYSDQACLQELGTQDLDVTDVYCQDLGYTFGSFMLDCSECDGL